MTVGSHFEKRRPLQWRIVFLLQNDNILTDEQNATAKELYTAILTKTNTEVLCKAKWERVWRQNYLEKYLENYSFGVN